MPSAQTEATATTMTTSTLKSCLIRLVAHAASPAAVRTPDTAAHDLQLMAESVGDHDAPLDLGELGAIAKEIVRRINAAPGTGGYYTRRFKLLNWLSRATLDLRVSDAKAKTGKYPDLKTYMPSDELLGRVAPAWQAIADADKNARWEAQILAGTWTPPADRDDDDILTN